MRKIFLFVLLETSLSNLLAQKTINDPNAEKRIVSGFHGINVGTGIKLIISEGSSEDVVVSAAKIEYREKIVTIVEKGILKIYYENKFGAINSNKEKKELKAYVSYKTLDELDANTGSQIEIDGILGATSLVMRVNTGSTVKGAVKADEVKVDQNTGSVVTLTGQVGKLV